MRTLFQHRETIEGCIKQAEIPIEEAILNQDVYGDEEDLEEGEDEEPEVCFFCKSLEFEQAILSWGIDATAPATDMSAWIRLTIADAEDSGAEIEVGVNLDEEWAISFFDGTGTSTEAEMLRVLVRRMGLSIQDHQKSNSTKLPEEAALRAIRTLLNSLAEAN